jgi:hypothetical protein
MRLTRPPYAEWLRIKRTIIGTTAILAILLAAAATFRLASQPQIDRVEKLYSQLSPDAKRASRQMSGATLTTIYDPQSHKRVKIVEYGWNNKHIEVSQPVTNESTFLDGHTSLWDMQIYQVERGTDRVTTIDVDATVRLEELVQVALLVGLIVATVLGGALSRENNGHLEVVWMRPASRIEVALSTFLADAVCIASSQILAAVALLLAASLFTIPAIVLDSQSTEIALTLLLVPIAWYTLLTALTASMRRGAAQILTLSWPAAACIPVLSWFFSAQNHPQSWLDTGLRFLSTADPLSYVVLPSRPDDMILLFDSPLLLILVVTLTYASIALWQWNRLEV